MKIKLLSDNGYSTVGEAIGKVVDATPYGPGAMVTAEELNRVGAADAEGSPYPFFPDEYEVISDDDNSTD